MRESLPTICMMAQELCSPGVVEHQLGRTARHFYTSNVVVPGHGERGWCVNILAGLGTGCGGRKFSPRFLGWQIRYATSSVRI